MKQPTAPNLYSDLPVEDGQNYRLCKISEIEKLLINERDNRKTLYKKYKRSINITDGVETVLISTSVILTGIVLTIPIMFPLEIVAVVCGSLGACVKLVRRRLTSKAKKHNAIKVLAESKLNSVKDLISKALNDVQISDNEFKLILDELDKYNKMKDSIHSKQTGMSEDDQAQALSELKKKM